MHADEQLIGTIVFGIVALSFIIYGICCLINKICDKLIVRWENKRIEILAHPDRILLLEEDEFYEFAAIAKQYGSMKSFEMEMEQSNRILRCINAEIFDDDTKKK